MIDVKPTLIACTFEGVWLSATLVDKSYYALDFLKENDARDAIDQLSPSA